jgi:hypothetical protein
MRAACLGFSGIINESGRAKQMQQERGIALNDNLHQQAISIVCVIAAFHCPRLMAKWRKNSVT